MTTGAIAAVVFIALIVSLVLTVPIGFSLGIASLAYIFATDQLTLGFVARNMVTGTDSFPIMAIPFFVFAGELMGGGGISKRLLDVANVFFGRIRGGLAIVTVVVCMFFAAISGSGPATVAAVVFIALIVSLVLTVPIGFSLGIASLAYIFATDQLTLGFVARNMVTGTDSFPIMAIPFFVFAGELMGGGGISKRLLDVANVFFGRIRGGLAIVTVVVCMFFAAISGSGPATVAAVGGMVVPTMLEKGYDKKFVLALIAAAGSIGVIIPPSIPMVVYSVTVNSSVSSLFLAGFIPGILIGLVLIVYSYVYARKAGYKGDTEPFSIGRALREVWRGKWALLSPVIILGGIYGGIFTPTEAAAVSVIYSLIIGLFVHKELNFKQMLDVTKRSCETTATILVVIGCATGFSKVLTLGRIPTTVATLLTTMTDSKVLILLLINLLLLLVGCFMETVCAIMILAPILFPVVTALGVDPIHFGIIMVTNLAIGFITPPLGVNLFVASRVGETTLDVVIRGIVPFLVLMIATLMLITYVPAISMFLPNLLG